MDTVTLHMFLLCQEHDPCSLYLDAMIIEMGIFIGCGYGSHTRIALATLVLPKTMDALNGGTVHHTSILHKEVNTQIVTMPQKFKTIYIHQILSDLLNK
jgi:hypothetical protein